MQKAKCSEVGIVQMRKNFIKNKLFLGMMICGLLVGQPKGMITVFAQENETSEQIIEESETEITETEESETGTTESDVITLSLKQEKYDYGTRKIEVSWEAVSSGNLVEEQLNGESVYYVVSLYKDEQWCIVTETENPKASFKLPTYGEQYVYKVEAFKKMQGEESENMESQEAVLIGASEKFKLCFPKKMSTIVTTGVSSKKVKLSWEEVKGANKYQVSQKSASGKWKDVKVISGTSAKLDVKNGKKYTYKVVPIYKKDGWMIGAKEKTVTYDNNVFVATDHQKYTYKEMESDIRSLSKKYGEYISYESIGESEQGRKIYDVILGNPKAKSTILVVSTLHSREYVATVTLMKQLEYYLQNYNKKIDGVVPSQVFEKCCVHYVMMANPDGVTICQNGDLRRKTNANGVNLNCDFPYKSSMKLSERQKETQAIISLTKKLNKKKKLYVVNYHAMGQIVFGDYSGKNAKVKKSTKDMYQIAREATGYADAGGYDNGSGKGNYREYLIYTLGIPSITIEVGDIWCPVPQSRYASVIRKNKYVILREADYVATAVKK